MVKSRFQKITRDSTTDERRSLNGSGNNVVLIGVWCGGRRKVHCRFGFASEGMKSGSGALLQPLYPFLEIRQ
jgi:hypothetical protein